MPNAHVNGIDIWYDVTGPDDGKPLLLISGVGTQSTRWPDAFVQHLLSRGYRVIRMDNRDIGLSQKFTDHGVPDFRQVMADKADGKVPDIPYTLSDMAADGIALLDHLEIAKAHVCGFSMGGMIVQLMAIEHPERVSSVTSIMSNSGNPDLPTGTPEAAAVLTRPRPIQSRMSSCARRRRPISNVPTIRRDLPGSMPRSLPPTTGAANCGN